MDLWLQELRQVRWGPMVERVSNLKIGGEEGRKAQERSHRTSEPLAL